MCGIVCYFGNAGLPLTRLLTAMSAISYRAPDSTGLALFGDDQEPIRIRRALGDVSELGRALLGAAAYPNQAGKLRVMWQPAESLEAAQRRLLTSEGFPVPEKDAAGAPTLDDLLSGRRTIAPGTPGSALPLPVFATGTPAGLLRVVQRMAEDYDLSSVMVRTLFREGLRGILAHSDRVPEEIRISEVLDAFDLVFEAAMTETEIAGPGTADRAIPIPPAAWEAMWSHLREVRVGVPEDFDRDGVRGLFRWMDAALLTRLPLKPERHFELQEALERAWPAARARPNTDWRTLYSAEKGANVFGRAAAMVLNQLRHNVGNPGAPLGSHPAAEPGRPEMSVNGNPANGHALNGLSRPAIAHGRWAIQSGVTLANCHPFFDGRRRRAVMVNGQFSSETEGEVRNFLLRTGFRFRSENSTEYFSLLWGHYFDVLSADRRRFAEIEAQAAVPSEELAMGSQAVDYRVLRNVRGRSDEEIDELAFREAARRMIARRAQLAVSGISLHSPDRLFVACHNRPAYLVHRMETSEYMVVSDVNAALGLFPQALILNRSLAVRRVRDALDADLAGLRSKDAPDRDLALRKSAAAREENRLLEPFRVTVYPLEGERLFVRIVGTADGRRAEFTDLDGEPAPPPEAFSTVLNPVRMRREVFASFFETHLAEIPERLRDIRRTYCPGEPGRPELPLRERELRRRFGPRLERLERVVLAGMGSARNVAEMAAPFFRRRLPELSVRTLQPVQVDDLDRTLSPRSDLVILVSWSGTTADMVAFARDLDGARVTNVSVTEKVFADMALISQRSGGVLPTLTGEEVTVSAVKSPACMLHCLHLLALWLADRRESRGRLNPPDFDALPAAVERLLGDRILLERAGTVARNAGHCHAALVIGDVDQLGTVREACLKMEENSWTAVGRPFIFPEILAGSFGAQLSRDEMREHLVLVSATPGADLRRAAGVIDRLRTAGVPFSVISARETEAAPPPFSETRPLVVPAVDPELQPVVDTVFYTFFALQFARAQGRSDDQFPRNRAKSVTAGRTREVRGPGPGRERDAMVRRLAPAASTGGAPRPAETAWERRASGPQAREIFGRLREIAGEFGTVPPAAAERLARAMADSDGEILLRPLDPGAERAARSAACQWPRFLGRGMHTLMVGEPTGRLRPGALTLTLATQPADAPAPPEEAGPPDGIGLAIGAEIPFFPSADRIELPGIPAGDTLDGERLYGALNGLLLGTLRARDAHFFSALSNHFASAGAWMDRVLDDRELRAEALRAMADNRVYRTAFFLGGDCGEGMTWTGVFDRISGLDMTWHRFGEASHGPLATVDNRAAEKYVRLTPRHEMTARWGDRQVRLWERRHLGGRTVDEFRNDPSPRDRPAAPAPFFDQGAWYLPVLRKGYDAELDNLILLDASRAYPFAQALDDLATFGCRFARMVVITQTAFSGDPVRRELLAAPAGHLLRLPSLRGENGAVPVPGFLLPLAMRALAEVMAGATVRLCGDADAGMGGCQGGTV
jgi:glucosamine 6-phosphate synthetase-like amidotransferase/phosphosugar isomerase protein